MDVGGWLRKLGLERYEPVFRENRVDGEILPSLTAEDLKDLGVGLVGDRRKLLDAIAALREETGTASETTAESRDKPRAASAAPIVAKPAAPAPFERATETRHALPAASGAILR